MTKTGSLCGLIGAGLLLAGCVASGQPDYPLQCIAELNPPGAYGYPAGVAAPTVVPETGGTQAGADAINACVRTKTAAPAAKPRKAVVETQSTTGTMTTKTYTYGTPRDRNGKLIAATPAPTTPVATPPRTCSYAMVGGSGYACDTSPMRRRF